MNNLIKLHYKFDITSISYAEFILCVHENGIALQNVKFMGHTVQFFIEAEEEIATMLKLRFGYFQIKVKTDQEIEEANIRSQQALQDLMTKYPMDTIWDIPKKRTDKFFR